MCSSCPPAGAQRRVRSVTDGASQKQKEQQQAEKSSATRPEASASTEGDDGKRSNDNDVAGAGGVGPKESGGKSRNKRVQTGRKGGVRTAAMADASAAESSASGEWDM